MLYDVNRITAYIAPPNKVVYAWMLLDVMISLFGTLTEYFDVEAECARDKGRRSRKGI